MSSKFVPHTRLDFSQESVLAVQYIVLIPFNYLFHKSSCMRSGNISYLKKGIANGCSVRYNKIPEYLIHIPLVHQISIPDNRHCLMPPMLITFHTILLFVLRPFLCERRIISNIPFIPYQNTLCVKPQTDLEHVNKKHMNPIISYSIFILQIAKCLEVKRMHAIDLHSYRLVLGSLFRSVWLNTLNPVARWAAL